MGLDRSGGSLRWRSPDKRPCRCESDGIVVVVVPSSPSSSSLSLWSSPLLVQPVKLSSLIRTMSTGSNASRRAACLPNRWLTKTGAVRGHVGQDLIVCDCVATDW